MERVAILFTCLPTPWIVIRRPDLPLFRPALSFKQISTCRLNWHHPLKTNTVLLQALKWQLLPNVARQVLTIRLQLLQVVISTSKAERGRRKPAITSPVIEKLQGGKTNPPAYLLNLPRRLLAFIVALTACTIAAFIV